METKHSMLGVDVVWHFCLYCFILNQLNLHDCLNSRKTAQKKYIWLDNQAQRKEFLSLFVSFTCDLPYKQHLIDEAQPARWQPSTGLTWGVILLRPSDVRKPSGAVVSFDS